MPLASFPRITVAIDGSRTAAAALDVAIDLAQRYGSELQILAVAPLMPVYIPAAEPFVPSAVPETEVVRYRSFVDEAVKRAEAAGVKSVTGVADEGVVVDEILAHLESNPTNLLVVGSRGLTAAKRLLLGSVSTALVNHAPCAVLVVRVPAKPPSG
jgi:nucleotide-binding universal stress UspA family protein